MTDRRAPGTQDVGVPEEFTRPAVLVVLWTQPVDVAAFDTDYLRSHLPLAPLLPGLDSLRTATLRSASYHRMAELTFASLGELRAAMASVPGRTLAIDAQRLERTHSVRAESHVALIDPPLAEADAPDQSA